MPAPIVVFDLDGTLTATFDVDVACFLDALRRAWHVEDVNTDWSSYTHCTDRGILVDVFRARYGRRPNPREMGAFVRVFLRSLTAARRRIRPIPGAQACVDALRRDGCAVAIATGSFRAAARLKVEAAGLDLRGVPLVAADDGLSREALVRRAVRRAWRRGGPLPLDRVVAVGDGTWDVVAARRLGVRFLGVGSGAAADRLRAAGARVVVSDLTHVASARALAPAAIP